MTVSVVNHKVTVPEQSDDLKETRPPPNEGRTSNVPHREMILVFYRTLRKSAESWLNPTHLKFLVDAGPANNLP